MPAQSKQRIAALPRAALRFHAEGEAAFEPRSRRPHHSPHQVSAELEDRIIRLRKELTKKGLDAGAETIRAHLTRTAPDATSTSTATTPPPSAVRL